MSWLVAGQWIFNAMVALVSVYLAYKFRRFEAIERRLEEKAEELITARMALASSELNTTMQVLASEIRRMNERLDNGDSEFARLRQVDESRRVEGLQQIHDTQREMLRLLSEVNSRVAKLEERMK